MDTTGIGQIAPYIIAGNETTPTKSGWLPWPHARSPIQRYSRRPVTDGPMYGCMRPPKLKTVKALVAISACLACFSSAAPECASVASFVGLDVHTTLTHHGDCNVSLRISSPPAAGDGVESPTVHFTGALLKTPSPRPPQHPIHPNIILYPKA